MFVIVAYDISDNRRRTKLFKTLRRFGSHVQRSVAEFHLSITETAHLKRAVQAVIDASEDEVRFYYLCPTCHERTEMTFPSRRTDNPFVVVA